MKIHLKITIDSYNKTAEKYLQNVSGFEPLPELDEFINLIDRNSHILDLGCGPGHHSRILVENGFKVTGTDLSSEMIRIAKTIEPRAEFHIMDMLKLDFNTNTFDAVWASASLIHLKKKEVRKVILKIGEILKPRGVLYISLKMGSGEKKTIDERYGGVKKFHSFFYKSEILSILENSGLTVLKARIKKKRATYDTNPWIHVFASND